MGSASSHEQSRSKSRRYPQSSLRCPRTKLSASSLNDLANVARNIGNFAKAERLLRRALWESQQEHGSEHPHTATILSNLATACFEQGFYKKAKRLNLFALTLKERYTDAQGGASIFEVAVVHSNLGHVYKQLGEWKLAEQSFLASLAITMNPNNFTEKGLFEGMHGQQFARNIESSNAVALRSLGAVYCELGRLNDAEEMLHRGARMYCGDDGCIGCFGKLPSKGILFPEKDDVASSESKEKLTSQFPSLDSTDVNQYGPLSKEFPQITRDFANLARLRNQYVLAEMYIACGLESMMAKTEVGPLHRVEMLELLDSFAICADFGEKLQNSQVLQDKNNSPDVTKRKKKNAPLTSLRLCTTTLCGTVRAIIPSNLVSFPTKPFAWNGRTVCPTMHLQKKYKEQEKRSPPPPPPRPSYENIPCCINRDSKPHMSSRIKIVSKPVLMKKAKCLPLLKYMRPSARVIHIEGNLIGNEGIKKISSCLRSVGNDMDEGRIVFFRFECGGNNLSSIGIDALLRSVRISKGAVLVSLELGCNELGDKGVTTLVGHLSRKEKEFDGKENRNVKNSPSTYPTLKHLNDLRELHLYGNQITDVSMKALSDMLHTNASLLLLGLGNNQITAKGARLLANALSSSSCMLTSLNLSYNKIGDEGATALANALQSKENEDGDCKWQNCHLREFHLSGNGITDTGGSAFSEMLVKNKVVEKFSLSGNKLNFSSLRQLIMSAVTRHSTVQKIDEKKNCGVKKKGKHHFEMEIVDSKPQLELDLRYNKISEKESHRISKIAMHAQEAVTECIGNSILTFFI
eukprot:g702.t1